MWLVKHANSATGVASYNQKYTFSTGCYVIGGLRQIGTKHGLRGRRLAKLTTIRNYLRKNLARMRYDKYLTAGYPIAGEVIDGACRYVVKDRMERAGMRWTVGGAQAMLFPRTTFIKGQVSEVSHPARTPTPLPSMQVAKTNSLAPGCIERKAGYTQYNCRRCHEQTIAEVAVAEHSSGDLRCWDCHRDTPHGTVRSLSSVPDVFRPRLPPIPKLI